MYLRSVGCIPVQCVCSGMLSAVSQAETKCSYVGVIPIGVPFNKAGHDMQAHSGPLSALVQTKSLNSEILRNGNL